MRRLVGLGLVWLTLISARADDGNLRRPGRVTAELGQAAKPSTEIVPPAEAPGAPADIEAAKGNPLWSAPLRSLSATRDRPLFSPSRRPPDTGPPPPQPSVAAPPPPPPAVAQAEPPPFTLIGTVLSADARLAVLLNKTTNAVTRLREGQSQDGWTAQKVDPRTAMLVKDGVENTLELPKTTDAPGTPPAPADAPAAGDDAQPAQ